MLVAGVDENGLGPQLGPLVTTAVVLSVRAYDAKKLARHGERVGIHDSKATSAFGKMAQAEAVSLALVEKLTGRLPTDADELLTQISVDGLIALRAPCPASSAPHCWHSTLALPAFGGDVAEGRRAFASLARVGVTPKRARSAIACVRVFNDELAKRDSKLAVDLALFERLLIDAREAAGQDLLSICGMVGGIRRYGDRFDHLAGRELEVLEESKRRAAYRVERLGELVFEVDSDAHHLPVALASMLGKYVREIAVERQNRYYRGHLPELPRASGYHDPVTKRFVAQSEPLRRRLQIADRCFVRDR